MTKSNLTKYDFLILHFRTYNFKQFKNNHVVRYAANLEITCN